jgi:hypothetical protein
MIDDSLPKAKSWNCEKCGSTNYCWRSFCIHCLGHNSAFDTERAEDEYVSGINKNETEAITSREENFLNDMAFSEIIDECEYFLYMDEYKRLMKRYRNLIKRYEEKRTAEDYRIICLYEQLAIMQEQTFQIGGAAKSLEIARSKWEHSYGTSDDDHREFLLIRLFSCYSKLHYIPIHGPRYNSPKATIYLDELHEKYIEKYGENSVQAQTICMDLAKSEFARGDSESGVEYLLDSLKIHKRIFWSAVKRNFNNTVKDV